MEYAIGVDLGGTKIEMGIVDNTGKIHARNRLETAVKEGPSLIERQIIQGIESLQKESNVSIKGIGIGVAGQIDQETGTVVSAPNLPFRQYPLRNNIEKALNLPTSVFNDVRAITFGEWVFGSGRNCQDFICVFIGTGIGSGVVSSGKLLSGFSNTFGEVGHMTIDYKGPLCTCGKKGCFEALAGGWGIAARAQEAIEADGLGKRSQKLLELAEGNIKLVTAKSVVQAYQFNDPLAAHLMKDIQEALIAGFASLVNLYNPQRLILGGGFIDGMPEMISVIEQGIKKTSLKAASQSLDVVKAQLGKNGGVLGSAAPFFKGINT